MLDQLLQLVREQAQEPVVNNPAVPNEQNEAVIGAATQSIATSLQQELANGNGAQLLSLFGSRDNNTVNEQNPLVNRISGNFVETLLQKFNLDKGTATKLAATLIPTVLGSLVKKTNDPGNSSFSLEGILNSLTGGSAQGVNLSGILGRLTNGGLDKDGDGDVDLKDIMSALTNGAQQQQQQQQGQQQNDGGLGGLLKGLFN
ncbi:hypothetical protein KTO58_25625 [Chitinophaga pendula]|uniref:hypothetical protein n=1 Tax=Chitinophaga TaxID=79328 RepID=UPI000BB0254A|nr:MULTISPECIES: hypothetical protein [Chitinophaga]ASZ10043.1 hypothetical protein CK934_03140 [Chitinophaga sp. MD30]UCJ07006.1 hypothetical protein KTO58_25625 [Chitinophaga pendula]